MNVGGSLGENYNVFCVSVSVESKRLQAMIKNKIR
jgi:hypothetical protein